MDLGDYVDVHEAALLIERKESMIRTLCQQGRFQGITKIGKSWLIPREEVLKYRPAKRGRKTPSTILTEAIDNADNLQHNGGD